MLANKITLLPMSADRYRVTQMDARLSNTAIYSFFLVKHPTKRRTLNMYFGS